MPESAEVNIRRFETKDRQAVRRIIHDTALLGESASLFFEGREVFSDALSLYYTDYEPQSCFVAEINSEIVACLVGAKNKIILEKTFNEKIAPGLLCKALKNGVFLNRKNMVFILSCIWDAIRGRMSSPDFSKEYPAILHVNVSSAFRRFKIGSRLIASYLEYLRQERVLGVHLATMSESGANFFTKQGFKLLYTGQRSYFRPALHKDIPLYIYGMKLL